MRFTFRHTTSALMLTGLLTACAATGDSTTIDEPDAGSASDSGLGPDVGTHDSASGFDSASAQDTGGGMTCKANCTSDSDCQNSCPPAPNSGVNCCDIGSGVCFASSSSTCPSSGSDAGMD